MDKKAKFRSAGMLLDVLQKEHKIDRSAHRTLYNRAGVALGVIGIYGFLLLQLVPPLGREKSLLIEGLGAVSLSGIMYAASMVAAIAAVIYLLRILFSGSLNRIDLEMEFDESRGKRSKDRAAMDLVNAYRDLCKENRGILGRKEKAFHASLRMLTVSIVLLVIYLAMIFLEFN